MAAVALLYRESIGGGRKSEMDVEDVSGSAAHTRLTKGHVVIHLALLAFCQTGLLTTTGFLLHGVFGWDARNIGLVLFFSAFAIVLAQSMIVARLMAKFGEMWTSRATLALVATMAATIYLGISNREIVVGCIAILFAGFSMSQTALNTLLSKQVRNSTRGVAMGRSNSVSSFGRVIGPIAFGGLFAIQPTVPYLVAFVILITQFAFAHHAKLKAT